MGEIQKESDSGLRYTIRPVSEADAGAIVELLNPLIRAGKYSVMDKLLSPDDQLDFIRCFPERGVFNVAVSSDSPKVLGLQDVMPISMDSTVFRHVGVISTFVALAAQRQGVGRSLSQVTFQAASALGFIKISAAIRADNPAGVSFYQSQGFKIIGIAQKHAFVGGRYIDELLLEKFIDPETSHQARPCRKA